MSNNLELFFLPESKCLSEADLRAMHNKLINLHGRSSVPSFDDFVANLGPLEIRDYPSKLRCDFKNRNEILPIEERFLSEILDMNSQLYSNILNNPAADLDEKDKLQTFKNKVQSFNSKHKFCTEMNWNNTKEMVDILRDDYSPYTKGEMSCGPYTFPLLDTIPINGRQFVLGRVSTLSEGGYYDCNEKFISLMSSYWDPRNMIEQDAFIACIKHECLQDYDEHTFAARIVLSPYSSTSDPKYQTWTTVFDSYMKVLHREICQLNDLTLWQSREFPTILFLAKRGESKDLTRFWQVSHRSP